ncbi:MAG: hypothetical protein OQK12_02220, partial [Motiliproteus sp.]|nr:hypothetical protein [Motiliproteus sp.]
MARLTAKDEERIKQLIQNWSNPKLTWELLVAACKKQLDIDTTRQALNKRQSIKNLLSVRKVELKAPSQQSGYVKDLKVANERIQQLTDRNVQLEQVNNFLIDKLFRWQYNASLQRMTEA